MALSFLRSSVPQSFSSHPAIPPIIRTIKQRTRHRGIAVPTCPGLRIRARFRMRRSKGMAGTAMTRGAVLV